MPITTVKGASLGDGAVTTAKVASSAITDVQLATDSVQGDEIASLAVSTAELAGGAVTDVKLAADAVTTVKIANDNVTLDKMEHGTSGDVLYYGAGGAPLRLAKGSDGQSLQLAGGLPAWAASYAVDSENLYTAQQRMTLQTDTSSAGAVTFNFAGGDCFLDLTEDVTSITISNLPENAWATLIIQQGATPRTVTGWSAAVKWPAATAPTISTTDNAYDVFSFYKKGTDIIASVSQDHR
jgi:hypothetical protein